MLKLPQMAIITAMTIIHRFYFKNSFKKYNLKSIIPSWIFLATKLEETPKKIRDVISVVDYLYKLK